MIPVKIVEPAVANPLLFKYVIVVLVDVCGILPVKAAAVVVFVAASVYVLYVFVFGDASGADDDNNPATNLNISDTFDSEVKLLK